MQETQSPKPEEHPFFDALGRYVPPEILMKYARDSDTWKEYALKLEELALAYENAGMAGSAKATRQNAANIRRMIRAGEAL